MAAQIIDGKQLSKALKVELKEKVASCKEKYGTVPKLVAVLVGEDPASQTYVGAKEKAANLIGFESELILKPTTISEADLLTLVDQLNEDQSVNGILVQLPLPKHIDVDKVIDRIAIEKDVDGFHTINVGNLSIGKKSLIPCTPKGIIKMIKSAGFNISGKDAVVVGRSNIVGKPIAQLLLRENATVTITHSRTADLAKHTKNADVLVVAAGRPKMVTAEYVKPGAIVIDVGIHRMDNGKLCGDVDFDSVKEVASHITPVPGGVGPMTIACLMENTYEAFINQLEK